MLAAYFALTVLGALGPTSAYAHGNHADGHTHAAPNVRSSGHAQIVEAAAPALSAPLRCPDGSGGGCCCSGRARLVNAGLTIAACALLLWCILWRVTTTRRVRALIIPSLSTVLVSAPPRAPPISRWFF